MMRGLILLLLLLLTGCNVGALSRSTSETGPPSAMENSTRRPKLEDRIAFIEQYVTFRRTYLRLEYDVFYQNNGIGDLPGPSDWSIMIVAVVPPTEINNWIPAGIQKANHRPPAWVKIVPGNIPTAGVTEWYHSSSVNVGIDRKTSTVVYRSSTMRN